MGHPYRRRHSEPPDGSGDELRMGTSTLAFGVVCVVCGLALAGSSRPYMVLVAALLGPAVIVTKRE